MLTMFNSKENFISSDVTVALLPLGAIEQHGNHLPVGTDILIVEELAKRIAEKIEAYLLPVIPITCSIEHRLTKGTVYLKAATLSAIIKDIAESLRFSGFKKLYLLSGHGGNWIVKPTVRELNRELEEFDVVLISTRSAQQHVQKLKHAADSAEVHAGEVETSIMMHLHEEYVGDFHNNSEQVYYPQEYLDYFDMTEITNDGYWGSREHANAEKGKKIIELSVQAALDYIVHVEETRKKVEEKRQLNSRSIENNE